MIKNCWRPPRVPVPPSAISCGCPTKKHPTRRSSVNPYPTRDRKGSSSSRGRGGEGSHVGQDVRRSSSGNKGGGLSNSGRQHAMNVIKQQSAEIDRLRTENVICQNKSDKLNSGRQHAMNVIKQQSAEIDRLRTENVICRHMNDKLKSDNKSLQFRQQSQTEEIESLRKKLAQAEEQVQELKARDKGLLRSLSGRVAELERRRGTPKPSPTVQSNTLRNATTSQHEDSKKRMSRSTTALYDDSKKQMSRSTTSSRRQMSRSTRSSRRYEQEQSDSRKNMSKSTMSLMQHEVDRTRQEAKQAVSMIGGEVQKLTLERDAQDAVIMRLRKEMVRLRYDVVINKEQHFSSSYREQERRRALVTTRAA